MSAVSAGGAGKPAAADPARPAYFATGWTTGHNPWAIALVVTMATFMEVLDTSIANVSLPHIAGNLSVSQDESTWVLTSYLVSNAIVLPISGWLASQDRTQALLHDLRGAVHHQLVPVRRRAVAGPADLLPRSCRAWAAAASGRASRPSSPTRSRPPSAGMAFAVYGMAVVLAPAIGPTLGGFITDHFSWRWVFFINVPVGLVSLFLTQRLVTDPPHIVARRRRKTGGIDYIGLGLIAVGLGALELVLDKGQEDDWFPSPFIVGCSIVAAVSLIVLRALGAHAGAPGRRRQAVQGPELRARPT